MKQLQNGKALSLAAAKAAMSDKTARKYLDLAKLPSQVKLEHTWRTRKDPFVQHWQWVKELLQDNSGLEAKTIFAALQREFPGKYQDGQLRTLQRRIKLWRATEGPGQEVFFAQDYQPGQWSCSDFTDTGSVGVTICGEPFDHLVYHFVLPYSNWETGTICFSESIESLVRGLQDAFWQLGGVTKYHRTDRLTAAIKLDDPDVFTQRYQALQAHYGFEGRKTQPASPHQNGDVEQAHHRFKRALDQALMLRGSRDFSSRPQYEQFLRRVFDQRNSGRKVRLQREVAALEPLPGRRLEDYRRLQVKVSGFSTVRVMKNTYSVHSRLKGQTVQVRLYAEHLEVWYAQRKVDQMPRLRGEGRHLINYRHIIEQLLRKPGAFENYRYRDCLFPSSDFRTAYDLLCMEHGRTGGVKEYLKVLEQAARDSECGVQAALRSLIRGGSELTAEAVRRLMDSSRACDTIAQVEMVPLNLYGYDELLECREVIS